ncbi:MAG: hypothetical protein ACEPOW_05860 [Bacteroidales bacterium]
MKKISVLACCLFIYSQLCFSQGQGPPPPPGNHGSNDNQPLNGAPSGGGAPIGDGVWIMIALGVGGLLYSQRELLKIKKVK